ncbi:MAG TPA: VCBS repeat-containing protein [Polyangia bacterium]|nr:VCBS repeat-containing protein [Polyangia bacterium]
MKRAELRPWTAAAAAIIVACSGGGGGHGGTGGNTSAGGTSGEAGVTGAGGASPTGGSGGSSSNGGSSGGASGGGAIATGGSSGGTSGGGGSSTGGAGGSGGVVASGGAGGRALGSCTDTVLRTAPPAGKEMFKADPVDTKFPFAAHWIGTLGGNLPIGITGLADYDHDGDLDFSSGQKGGPMYWWEQCTADHWVQHMIGTGHATPGGGNATDVDGDGWVDVVAGDSWYRNPKLTETSRSGTWSRFPTGVTGGAEDIVVGDVSGDGKPDVLFVWNAFNPNWRMPGPDPTIAWPIGASLANVQTQGGAIGDLDHDGDNDIVVGNQWWYRNMDGKGKQWETVHIATGFDDSPLVNVGDLDGDGDMDLVMCTHFGSRIAWVESGGGQATTWTLHILATGKKNLHAIFALDFDNDGDLDIFAGESAGHAWIYENTDGKGTFVEHDAAKVERGHDARVGDVDCDGDLDIVGAPWDDAPSDHVYLQNMTVERGGRAVFTRPAGEIWRAEQRATGCKD